MSALPKVPKAPKIEAAATDAAVEKAATSIPLLPGKLHEAVRASIEALAQHSGSLNLFQRGDFLVRPTLVEGYGFRDASGARPVTRSLRFKRLSAITIRIELSRVAIFTRQHGRRHPREDVVDCSKDLAQSVYESNDQWHGIPLIESISETPLYDGHMLFCGPGVRNGIYVLAPEITLPERPSKEDALKALARVSAWIDEFGFTDPRLDRAALLAFFLTAALRFSIDNAPGFAITKHDFGSGATTAAKMAAIIATGREPSVMPCDDETELEKQVTASLIHGANVRILDNLPEGTELRSRLLAQSLSERLVKVRILGESREVECPSAALVAVTGVNIQTAADLNRRFIRISLDPRMSSPETRTFRRKNIIELLARDRASLLCDLFTIAHAYNASGEQAETGDLVGFDHWVRWVVQPLMWLGEANVLHTIREATVDDPVMVALRRIIPLISELGELLGGASTGVLASEMIAESDQDELREGPAPTGKTAQEQEREANVRRVRRQLRAALGEATGARQFNGEWQLEAKKVGEWLNAHRGRYVHDKDSKLDRRVTKAGQDRTGSQRWQIETLGKP